MSGGVSEKAFSIKTRKPIDEDALLTEEDKADKTNNQPKEDCTTRRRACKNCTCGRAELERKEQEGAAVKLKSDTVVEPMAQGCPSGGCGNCSRGDAFRCANCPFLGKPAWSTGSDGKVTVNLADDA